MRTFGCCKKKPDNVLIPSHPETFQCRIVPRSEKHIQLILQEA